MELKEADDEIRRFVQLALENRNRFHETPEISQEDEKTRRRLKLQARIRFS